MKFFIGIVVIVAILFGAWWWFGMNKDAAMNDSASETGTTETSKPVSQSAPAPAANPQALQSVDNAFSASGSVRCEWTDGNSLSEGIALIQNGKVRVETKAKGTKQIVLYTTAGTYFWVDGEKTGSVVVGDLPADMQLGAPASRSALESLIRTGDRVRCEEQTFNAVHFEVPRNIEFSKVGE